MATTTISIRRNRTLRVRVWLPRVVVMGTRFSQFVRNIRLLELIRDMQNVECSRTAAYRTLWKKYAKTNLR